MKIPAFSCNHLHYISLLDYAYLSLSAYHDAGDLSNIGKFPNSVASLDSILSSHTAGWYQDQTPAMLMPISNNFYADLYYKVYENKVQHVMLAIRGTVASKLGNDLEDAQAWYSAVKDESAELSTPDYFDKLTDFIVKIYNQLEKLRNLNLLSDRCTYHVTGHSLGGALANLINAHKIPLNTETGKPPYVISFNAPGIRGMPNVATFDSLLDHTLNVRATYDFISKIGERYGEVVNIHVPEKYETAKACFQLAANYEDARAWDAFGYLLTGHVEKAVINAYDSEIKNPLSGIEIKKDFLESVLQQHSMSNLLNVITSHPQLAHETFATLLHSPKTYSFNSWNSESYELAS